MPLNSRNINKRRFASALCLTAALLCAAHVPASAKDRVTYDRGEFISSNQQQEMARYFAGLAYGASAPCAASVIQNRIPGVVPQLWIKALTGVFGADDGCEVAKKAGTAAAWLWYYSQVRGKDYFRMYVYRDDRRIRPDVCHVYINIGGRWIIGDGRPFEALKYSTMGRLKCIGE